VGTRRDNASNQGDKRLSRWLCRKSLIANSNVVFKERWAQVTKYVNDHSKNGSTNPKNEKDIIKEVKRMKSAEASTVLQSSNTYVAPKPTNNVEEPAVDDSVWTATQQKQLETGKDTLDANCGALALKLVNSKDPERWDKVAKTVEGKTKKQCVARYRELVQMIKESKK
jgi:DnaJ family protein C protein 2